MFKIKLLILLLISYILSSCVNNTKVYFHKMSVGYIGGEYDGLVLSNELKGQLNNFDMFDMSSRYEIRANVSHSQNLYITNIDNTSSRENIDTLVSIKIFDKELSCFTYVYDDAISQFYILASSDQFISNRTAVEEIKIKNTEYLVIKFINSISQNAFTCDDQK